MNWKSVAENDLRLYNLRQQSLGSIREKIAVLKATQDGLKAVDTGKVLVKGGKAQNEDRLIDGIVETQRLKLNYTTTARLIRLTEKGLAALQPEEREVLDCFYISGCERCAELLRERLGYEKSQVYRIKDRALYKFTVACYGVVDL